MHISFGAVRSLLSSVAVRGLRGISGHVQWQEGVEERRDSGATSVSEAREPSLEAAAGQDEGRVMQEDGDSSSSPHTARCVAQFLIWLNINKQ